MSFGFSWVWWPASTILLKWKKVLLSIRGQKPSSAQVIGSLLWLVMDQKTIYLQTSLSPTPILRKAASRAVIFSLTLMYFDCCHRILFPEILFGVLYYYLT